MKLSERSLMAREKFADSNMSVANSIASAVFIGILVSPLLVFITDITQGNEPSRRGGVSRCAVFVLQCGRRPAPLGGGWLFQHL